MHSFLARLKARDLSSRAKTLIVQTRSDEALTFATEAYSLSVDHLTVGDLEYALAFSYLAAAYAHTGDNGRAIELLDKIVINVDTSLATLPEERLAVYNNLAVCYQRQKQPEKSIPLMSRAVTEKAKYYGEDSTELLGNLEDLADAFDAAGRFRDAESTIRHMLRIIEFEFGTESREYVQTLAKLLACLTDGGRTSELAALRREIAQITGRLKTNQKTESLVRDAKEAYLEGDYPRARRIHRALLARTPVLPLPDMFSAVVGDMLDPLFEYAGELDRSGFNAETSRDFETAIKRYRAVVEIFRVSRDDYGMRRGTAMSNLAFAYQLKGDLEGAKPWFEKAFATLAPLVGTDERKTVFSNVVSFYWALCDREAPDPSSNLDAAYKKIGEITKGKGADYARSLLARFPLPNPDDDRAEEMRKWIDARIAFYMSFGGEQTARALHTNVVEMHELLFKHEPRRIFAPLFSFVHFAIGRGPAGQARFLLDKATELAAGILHQEPQIAAETLRLEARFRSSISDNVGAEDALLDAREILEKLPETQQARNAIESDLLVVWLQLGKRGAAVDDLLDREIEDESARLEIDKPENVQHLADLLGYRKQWQRAEELYRQALAKQKEQIGEWDPRYALTLSNFGTNLRMQGRYEEALPLFSEAVRIRVLEFGSQHQSVARVRVRLALTLAALQHWQEASSEMEKVLKANEVFLQSTAAITSREQLFRILQADHSALDVFISVGVRLPPSPAVHRQIYEAVLRRKGLGLEALAARRLTVLNERYSHQHEALAELDHISSIISEAVTSSMHERIDLTEALARKRQLETKLAAVIPELGLEAMSRSADAEGIRAALDENCALIEYVQFSPFNFEGVIAEGDSEFEPPRYLGFVISKNSDVEMRDLGPASVIDADVMELGRLWAGNAGGFENFTSEDPREELPDFANAETLHEAGQRVRRLVWDPLQPLTNGSKHILVAPDGTLGLLPFDLLPENGDQLLLDTVLISNLSSGRDVIRFANATLRHVSSAAIFCAPDFDLKKSKNEAAGLSINQEQEKKHQHQLIRSLSDRGITHVVALPGAEREGLEVQELLPGSRLFSGTAASEVALRALNGPLVLHIATHGFAAGSALGKPEGTDDGMFDAGLVFAGANIALLGQEIDPILGDAVLTGEEAATLRLQGTELVVLSACRSGVGEAVPGEGVFGLHRAFVAAGARCVMVSLWKIPDNETRELMTILYKELRNGVSRAEAMRNAKRRGRQKHPHPFFWGSFLCHGDWRDIPALVVR